jgi:hypothetical protein
LVDAEHWLTVGEKKRVDMTNDAVTSAIKNQTNIHHGGEGEGRLIGPYRCPDEVVTCHKRGRDKSGSYSSLASNYYIHQSIRKDV